MKVILLKDVRKLGRKYEIKTVADGYATNSLIPQQLAVPATASYIKLIDEKKKQDSIMSAEFKKAFEYGLSKLPGGKLSIHGKVSDKGHLFAGIQKDRIIEEFKKATGIALSADHFELEKPIKDLGEHTIPVTIDGAKYSLKVVVNAEK